MLGAVGKETREALISCDCTFTQQHPTFENPSRLGMVLPNETVKTAITVPLPLFGVGFSICKRNSCVTTLNSALRSEMLDFKVKKTTRTDALSENGTFSIKIKSTH